MKKRNSRLLACALAVVLCMTAFSIPTFAAGYYASNENGNNTPPDAIESITVSTENVNLPANSSASGIPALTPDGNLTSIDDILQSAASVSTEDSLENKQFITVQSKSGNTFYIVIDRSGDTENVYFLNLVDEADLMALMGDDAEQADTTCICQTHCEVGAINTDCPVCKASMQDADRSERPRAGYGFQAGSSHRHKIRQRAEKEQCTADPLAARASRRRLRALLVQAPQTQAGHQRLRRPR